MINRKLIFWAFMFVLSIAGLAVSVVLELRPAYILTFVLLTLSARQLFVEIRNTGKK